MKRTLPYALALSVSLTCLLIACANHHDNANEHSAKAIDARASFYEGDNGTQKLLCTINVEIPAPGGLPNQRDVKFGKGSDCPNDEARSVVLEDFTGGSTITVTDDPNGDAYADDSATITVKTSSSRIVVYSFENERVDEKGPYTLKYYHKNGLNGKVSFAKFQVDPEE